MRVCDQELVCQFLRRYQIAQEVSDGKCLRLSYRLFITAELACRGGYSHAELLKPWVSVCRAMCCDWLNMSARALERQALHLEGQVGKEGAAVDPSVRILSDLLVLRSQKDERTTIGDSRLDPLRHLRRLDFICSMEKIKGQALVDFCAYSFALQGGRFLPFMYARNKMSIASSQGSSLPHGEAELAFGAGILPQQSLDLESSGEGDHRDRLVAREVEAYSSVIRSL